MTDDERKGEAREQGTNNPQQQASASVPVLAKAEPAKDDGAANKKDYEELDAQDTVRLNMAFTAILTIATALQALFACWQWNVMEKQADQTDRALGMMRQEQRACLSILKTSIDKPVADQPMVLRFELRNSGKTPALFRDIATIFFAADVRSEKDIADNFTQLDRWTRAEHNMLIPPDSPTASHTERELAGLSDALLSSINANQVGFYVGIRITYEDIGKQKHSTKVCYMYYPKLNRLGNYGHYDEMD